MRYFILFMTACRLPHVEPALRDNSSQRATLAAITSSCTEPDPFLANPSVPNDPTPENFPIVWAPDHQATGVVISERHILTAAHAVGCPAIPSVTVVTRVGERKASVERDDEMYPHTDKPTDLARLELSAANGFGLNIAPPVIREAIGGETCCAETLRGEMCGTINPYYTNYVRGLDIRPGDSGSPLYCDGALVGLILTDGGKFVSITPYWLEGT